MPAGGRSCRVATNSTLHQRFTRVRLPGSHQTRVRRACSATLTTSAIEPTQLAVVWSLPLQSGSEGPRLPSLLQPASVRSTCYIDPSFCLRGARLSSSAVSLPWNVELGADLTCQHRPRPVLVRRSPHGPAQRVRQARDIQDETHQPGCPSTSLIAAICTHLCNECVALDYSCIDVM